MIQTNEDYGIRHEYFECKCDSEEHVLRVTYFVNDENNIEENEVYFSLYLEDRGFWARVYNGIRYIFGYKSKYGDFESISIKVNDAESLRDLLDSYIQDK